MKIDDNVFEFVKKITKIDTVQQVVLFGSKAAGTSKKESDTDIFVVLENLEKRSEIEDIAHEINQTTGIRIELTFSDSEFSGFDESFISDVYGSADPAHSI